MNLTMSHEVSHPAHCYTIELRFTGDNLDPVELTRRFNLQPHNATSGSGMEMGGRKRRPFWAYNGHCEDGFQAQWQSLDLALNFLIHQLLPHRKKIINLSKEFEGVWWCGHFQASFNGGPTLSARTLGSLSSFGLPLTIDNYFSD